jgi:hypothetical protein
MHPMETGVRLMKRDLRKLAFYAALVLSGLIVLIELGALGFVGEGPADVGSIGEMLPPEGEVSQAFDEIINDPERLDELMSLTARPPGLGIPYLALLDGIILFTVGLIALSGVISQRIQGRVQGLATLVFSIVIIILGIIMAIVAFAFVMVMISLLLTVPFGTLAYLVKFGFFNKAGAAAILGLLMAFKLAFAVCLVFANPRYLQNKGLVLLIVTSLVANVILGFLHGLVPRFMVSITDGIGAIIVAILAVIWAIVLLVGAIPAVVRALQLSRV